MILNPPFFISARLAPALKFDDGSVLSLVDRGVSTRDPKREFAGFVIDFPDGTEYINDDLNSGCGGFRGVAAIFEDFLGFMSAAVSSYEYELENPGSEGENTDLFPLHIVKWAAEENGHVRNELIEVQA